eukprot:CAMPEP_0116869068 /NCGR_PEP_ID=MMETSP0418-20121206/27553_1 /TAXON_ID=1158023 /ORGANISM="Astrosyne radiata, Strain 13vi08-1A" /LENGTH=73 /DNA_ID=CAMNT_0004505121 /DNA_START=144 /DNA_END=365 /DNA_ORIENTATION=-
MQQQPRVKSVVNPSSIMRPISGNSDSPGSSMNTQHLGAQNQSNSRLSSNAIFLSGAAVVISAAVGIFWASPIG